MTKWNFMLAVAGVVALGAWLLQIVVSATAILPIDLLVPVVVDTDKRILVVPAQPLTQLNCASCGVVVSMRLVTAIDGAAVRNPVGSAVFGSMIGNLMGGTRGQELFGWLGAIAAIRNGEVLHPGMYYETTIRFDDGGTRAFVNITRPQWRDGDQVRVVEGAIQTFRSDDVKLKAEVTLPYLLSVAPVWR
ncbi:MAG: hypothetical protein Q8M20_04060 [Rhodocyclaceae bacterium]|nr:hypothetical protein [Rhodocyclaceae bacterium]MDZ4213932.1 hypothetical protein [Rhodocyclaceae bacterium]